MIHPIRPWRLSIAYASAFFAFVLLFAGQSAAAGWLDKLKEMFGDSGPNAQSLSIADIDGGLKEALRVGTETVVGRLGKSGGFDLDPQIHIPLPAELEQVRSVLAKFGMDSMLVDLEHRLNRAAEIATPKAKDLFLQSISAMTIKDVMQIYDGPDDAATRYFRSTMSAPLGAEMTPVVQESLADAGVVKVYDDVMKRYNDFPFVPQIDADLSEYVVEKSVDGIFYYVAQEEAAIRSDPAKRTTEVLERVFTRD